MLPLRLLMAEWHSGKSVNEIAAKYRIHPSSVYNLARRHHLPKRSRRVLRPEPQSPTPDEIEARSAEVRSWWSESERRRRVVGGSRSPHWTPPQVSICR